jgi:hypothetical protein
MRRFTPWLLALVGTVIRPWQVWGGTWTAGEFLYKPAMGARGAAEKSSFDSALDKVDARLAKEY